jgi:hypothetical protein
VRLTSQPSRTGHSQQPRHWGKSYLNTSRSGDWLGRNCSVIGAEGIHDLGGPSFPPLILLQAPSPYKQSTHPLTPRRVQLTKYRKTFPHKTNWCPCIFSFLGLRQNALKRDRELPAHGHFTPSSWIPKSNYPGCSLINSGSPNSRNCFP